jgi:hypothetical protein
MARVNIVSKTHVYGTIKKRLKNDLIRFCLKLPILLKKGASSDALFRFWRSIFIFSFFVQKIIDFIGYALLNVNLNN